MRVNLIHSLEVDFIMLDGISLKYSAENRRYFENVDYRVGGKIEWNGKIYKIDQISVCERVTFIIAYSD